MLNYFKVPVHLMARQSGIWRFVLCRVSIARLWSRTSRGWVEILD